MQNSMKESSSTSEELIRFLQEKAANHRSLKTYGKEASILPIIEEGVLRLSDGSAWNDRDDAQRFCSKRQECKKFAKCFTFSRTESVAMWLIYGGDLRGNNERFKGLMVDFKMQLNNVIKETEKVTLCYYDRNAKAEVGESRQLTKGEFEISLMDMLYYRETEKGYTLKRSDERKTVDRKVFEGVYNYTKAYAWAYENECRLIVSVPKAFIGNAQFNTAKIQLPDTVLENIEIIKSPLYPKQEECKISTLPSRLTGNIRFEV